MKHLALFFLFAVPMYSCNQTDKIINSDPNADDVVIVEKDVNNPFFAYNFGGLENLPPADQVKLLKDNGYDGITLRMAKAEHVDQYLEFEKIVSATPYFKIYAVFVRYNFDDSEEDKNRWKEVVDLIENKGIDLWFIFGKPVDGVNDDQVEGVLRNAVEYADSKKVPFTLYPHSWCYFDTTESALPMIKKINHPNLKIAVHTCHELKGANAGRLAEIVHKAKDYISFITIAGAAKVTDMNTRKSMDATTIQPLEDGEYDFAPFLKALKEIDFRGPVGYINFKFAKAPEDYLPKSLAEWNKLKNNYLNY